MPEPSCQNVFSVPTFLKIEYWQNGKIKFNGFINGGHLWSLIKLNEGSNDYFHNLNIFCYYSVFFTTYSTFISTIQTAP
jgi:hypothetical protein